MIESQKIKKSIRFNKKQRLRKREGHTLSKILTGHHLHWSGLRWFGWDKSGLTRSDAGGGDDKEGVSKGSDWLQVDGTCSEAAGDVACWDRDVFSFGGSASSSSFPGGEPLNQPKWKKKSFMLLYIQPVQWETFWTVENLWVSSLIPAVFVWLSATLVTLHSSGHTPLIMCTPLTCGH